MVIFEQRCLIISRLVEMGWEKEGRAFQTMAIELRDAFEVHPTDTELSNTGVHENTKSTVDPFDWMKRAQMGALVTMYSTIPKKIRDQPFHNETLSHPVWGLFRKDKEIEAVMMAAKLCMKQRREIAEGELHFSNLIKDNKTISERVELIKTAFNKSEDMKYAPSWDKRWDTNSALNMMVTADTHLQLIKVVKCVGETPEVPVDIKRLSDLEALLPSEEEPTGLEGVVLKFTFRRLLEIEDQPLDRIKRGGGDWHIYDTALLNLFTSLGVDGENTMIRLCGDSNNYLVKDFVRYRDEVAQDVCEALDRKLKLLKNEGDFHVAPATAKSNPDLVRFRADLEAKKTVAISEMGKLKNKSQSALQDYEKVIDAMKDYLLKVTSKFGWSEAVKKHVKEMRSAIEKSLQENRKAVGDYWNKQEGSVTKAATLKQQAAEAKEQEALQKEREAEELAKKRERDAMMAEAQAHTAEEKAKAEKATADAQIARAELQLEAAVKERDRAKEEMVTAQKMMESAYADQVESREKQEQAEKVATEARAREVEALKQERIVEDKMKILEDREAKVKEACLMVKTETQDEDDSTLGMKLYNSVAGIIGF